MLHRLDTTWSIQLPDDGSGSPDAAGDLVVESALGTIVVALFAADEGFDPERSLQDLKAADRPDPRAEFDEYGPDGTLRWAFLVDDGDEAHDASGQVDGAGGSGTVGTGVAAGSGGVHDSSGGGGEHGGGGEDGGNPGDSGISNDDPGHDLADDHVVALYGYVIAETGWVQVAVLYDDRRDHDQALGIWRSVRRDADTAA